MTGCENVVFVDTETTGLDPERHEAWEIALIADGKEHVFTVEPTNLAEADPDALRINRFYERTKERKSPYVAFAEGPRWDISSDVARWVARLTAGRHLVANVPSFDAAFLGKFLRRNNQAPARHYHLVDVEALVAGRFGLAPPWRSVDLSRMALVEPPSELAAHTALADARWAKALYESVFARRAQVSE